MTWFLGGLVAMAGEPTRLELESRAYKVVLVDTIPTASGVTLYTGASQPFVKLHFWAVDQDGQRVSTTDFARLVGEEPLAARMSGQLARRRAVATPLLLAGVGGWVVGGATLVATRESEAGPSPFGVLSLLGGQGCVVTSLVLSATNHVRRRRLDPWLGWAEADALVARYNEGSDGPPN